jgi:REP element-mobilizing transposase RayT
MRRPRVPEAPRRRGHRHVARPRVRASTPVHIGIKVRHGTWNLRSRRAFRILREAFVASQQKIRFRLIGYSVQGNHVHLIAEGDDTYAISRAMRGISIRVARRLNRLMGTKGKVIPIRYFMRVLRTPLQVKRALAYVLNNFRRHAAQWGEVVGSTWIDPYSSGLWFDGWSRMHTRTRDGPVDPLPMLDPGIVEPRSQVLREGWKVHGLIELSHVPGRSPAR